MPGPRAAVPPCADRRAANAATSASVAFHGSETRIACPASAPEPHRRQHVAGGDLAGAAGGPGADRDPVQVERDHLRIRPHPGQRQAGGIRPAAARRRRRRRPRAPSRPARPRRAARPAPTGRRPRRAANPAIAGTGGVPPRRPRSCPPPRDQRRRSRRRSAPAAARPPPSARPACARTAPGCRAPSAARSTGMRPAACTASTCSSAPWRRHSAAASAIGCSVPVSLLASIRQTSVRRAAVARPSSNSCPARRGRRRRGDRPAAPPHPGPPRAPRRARWRRRSSRRPAPSAWIASALASVAPEVNTRSAGRPPKRAASEARGRLPRHGAPRGRRACTEDGLPVSSSAASTAARAAGPQRLGRIGVEVVHRYAAASPATAAARSSAAPAARSCGA